MKRSGNEMSVIPVSPRASSWDLSDCRGARGWGEQKGLGNVPGTHNSGLQSRAERWSTRFQRKAAEFALSQVGVAQNGLGNSQQHREVTDAEGKWAENTQIKVNFSLLFPFTLSQLRIECLSPPPLICFNRNKKPQTQHPGKCPTLPALVHLQLCSCNIGIEKPTQGCGWWQTRPGGVHLLLTEHQNATFWNFGTGDLPGIVFVTAAALWLLFLKHLQGPLPALSPGKGRGFTASPSSFSSLQKIHVCTNFPLLESQGCGQFESSDSHLENSRKISRNL